MRTCKVSQELRSQVPAQSGFPRIAYNALVNLLNIIVGLVAGVIVSVILTRYLGPDLYGDYQTALWICTVATMLFGLGMSETVRRYSAELNGRGQPAAAFRLAWVTLWLQAGIGLVGIALLGVGAPQVASWLGHPSLKGYVVLAAVATGPELLSAILQGVLAGLQRFDYLTLVGGMKGLLQALGAVLIVSLDGGVSGLLMWLLLLNMVVASAHALLVYRLYRATGYTVPAPLPELGPMTRYAASVLFTLLMDVLMWQRIAVVFLNRFWSGAEVGFYTLGSSLAYLAVSTVPMGLSGVLMPALADRWGAEDEESMRRIYLVSLRSIALISLPICVGGAAVSGRLVGALYGDGFARTGDLLPWLLASSTAIILTSPASSLLHALRRADVLAKIAAGSAALNLALLWYLVPQQGALGAAVVSFVVRGVAGLLTLIVAARLAHVRYPVGRLAWNLAASGFCGIVAAAVSQSGRGWPGLFLSIMAGAAVYGVAVLMFQVVSPGERKLILASIASSFGARFHAPEAGVR